MWNWVQPGPSNMRQIKWEVSVYNIDCTLRHIWPPHMTQDEFKIWFSGFTYMDTATVKNRQTDGFIYNIYLIFSYKCNIKI